MDLYAYLNFRQPLPAFSHGEFPRPASMQTLLFPMPPTQKVQPLSTDNQRNRVFTPIPSTHYPARLQDHRWTLGDREPSVIYMQFYV